MKCSNNNFSVHASLVLHASTTTFALMRTSMMFLRSRFGCLNYLNSINADDESEILIKLSTDFESLTLKDFHMVLQAIRNCRRKRKKYLDI